MHLRKLKLKRKFLHSHSHSLQTIALRPHLIFGKGDPHLIPRLLDRARKGRLMQVGPGHNLVDVIHVKKRGPMPIFVP
jgi:nucleoside-diphosphate-sugar epimerase